MAIECGQIYKCNVCGNIVCVVHPGGGDLSCCGELMVLQVENTVDASKEKHVPVIEKVAGGYKVKLGSVPHPMEEKHYIEWIELAAGQDILIHWLKPGDAPEAVFKTDAVGVAVRAYCNLHGLWSAKS